MKTKSHVLFSVFAFVVATLLPVLGNTACVFSSGETGRSPVDSITIMTWNLQLLFDGVEEGTEFRDFRQEAGWTQEKYLGRLNVIVRAINEMEEKPDIIALQEVESAQVVADIAGALTAHQYNWTHFARIPGMTLGVAIISRYPLSGAISHCINIDGDIAPRPMIEARVNVPGGMLGDTATGKADGNSLLLFVCHWKSKLGGAEETESTRRASARTVLRRMRELERTNPGLPVVIAGDLNVTHDEFFRSGGEYMKSLMPDDPYAAEFAMRYFAQANPGFAFSAKRLQQDFIVVSHSKPPQAAYYPDALIAMYSPWGVEKEDGSFFFRNSWETIDHFLLSRQLFDETGWEFYDSRRVNVPPFVNIDGLPNTYNPRTGHGLSDHLPLLLFLRVADGD